MRTACEAAAASRVTENQVFLARPIGPRSGTLRGAGRADFLPLPHSPSRFLSTAGGLGPGGSPRHALPTASARPSLTDRSWAPAGPVGACARASAARGEVRVRHGEPALCAAPPGPALRSRLCLGPQLRQDEPRASTPQLEDHSHTRTQPTLQSHQRQGPLAGEGANLRVARPGAQPQRAPNPEARTRRSARTARPCPAGAPCGRVNTPPNPHSCLPT